MVNVCKNTHYFMNVWPEYSYLIVINTILLPFYNLNMLYSYLCALSFLWFLLVVTK